MGQFNLADLVKWSVAKLPVWQQDALRRLLDEGLAHVDRGELAALVKAPHQDLEDGESPKAVPCSTPRSQPKERSQPSVRLVRIRDIARVNALGEGPVEFAPEGLTVVFGPNASGKSGISRILKKACRASAPGGKVRPNVFEPEPDEPAAANIDFQVDGTDRDHAWRDGADKHAVLETVNVFDSDCAQVQVSKKNHVSFTPLVLQVFKDFVKLTDEVSAKLAAEERALGTRPRTLDDLGLDDATAAGQFLTSLTSKSSQQKLSEICTVTDDDRSRLEELRRALAEDPLQQAQVVETRSKKLRDFDTQVTSLHRALADEECDKLLAAQRARDSTKKAAEAARAAFTEQEIPLDGVGSDEWRALWEAARKFSDKHAYPDGAFPVTEDGSRCVLCQQVLEEGQEHLRSFEDFVKDEVQQDADKAQRELDERLERVEALPFPRSARELLRDAGLDVDESEVEALRRAYVSARVRCRHLLRVVGGQAEGSEQPELSALPKLQNLKEALDAEAERLRKAAQEEGRLQLVKERREIEDRIELSKHAGTVRDEIERLRALRVLELAQEDCKTQALTRKSGKVAKEVVTNRLRSHFTTNLVALGFGETPVEVQAGGGAKATHPYELRLMAKPDVPPSEVLSESERTCVGLAGMLSELETSQNTSAVVLDDPVSSLDQPYRKRVAERIVRESKGRQVIVFTHDVVFLYLLRKYAKELGATVAEVSLRRGYKGNHGRVTKGPPWEAMSVKQRIGRLRDDLVKARKSLKESSDWDAYQRSGSELYKRLRQAWERAIEEVLLNQTVLRFGDSVQTLRLGKLTDITDGDVELVTKEMSRCSDFVHDEAETVRADVPEADIVEADIKRLEDWVKELRGKRGR